MGGLGGLLLLRNAAALHKEDDCGSDGCEQHYRQHYVKQYLIECEGETQLRLYVVGLEVFHIYGRFRHLDGRRCPQNQGVAVHHYRERGQFQLSAVPGDELQRGLDVVTRRALLTLGNAGGIQLPVSADLDGRIFRKFQLGKLQGRSFLYVVKEHAVTQRIGNQHGIPFHEGLHDELSAVSLRLCKGRCSQQH